jgi:GDP-L-fucose synthase
MHMQRIFVAGHLGMVGSAIRRQLLAKGHREEEIIVRTRQELDLTSQLEVERFFQLEKPEQVYIAAARVGGILANNRYPAEFIYDNLTIQSNIINSAFRNGVRRLLFLGSSCIYPKLAVQPMAESALLTGPLEATNEPYALAKIAGIKMCESYNRQYGISHGIDYRCVMPANIYGHGDNYHPENSHVVAALLRRFHEAKINNMAVVTIWGTGEPRREFLYVDDMARACLMVMALDKRTYEQNTEPMCSHINVGSGSDLSIKELAESIRDVVGYQGEIVFDPTKPDGSPRKLMDIQKMLNFGWRPEVSLKEGLEKTYADYLA